jgi:hypothetical protein
MTSTQAASTETAERPIDPQLAAYEILRRMICRRPPFNEARPRAGEIPEDLKEEIETATLAYQLSMYLDIAERKFGLTLSEKIRAHVLLLSAFDPGLESQLPRFLQVIRRAEVDCALRGASEPSDDMFAKFCSILAIFTLIECGRPDERQKVLHASVGAHLGWAYSVAKKIFAPEVEAMNGVSKDFVWSAQPGPFERQLQRRQGNPLFPAPARSISADQVSAARLEDLKRSADFLKSHKPLVQQALSVPSQWPLKEGVDFLKKVIDLIEPCKTLGCYFSEEGEVLEKVADAVEKELVRVMKQLNEADFQDGLQDYRALSSVAGLHRRLTIALAPTAGSEDLLRTVLSEDCETISAFGHMCAAGLFGWEDHPQLAQRIIQAAVHDGMNADVALLKLNAFRTGFESAKPKPSSRIWQGLRKLVRRASI